MRRSLLYVHTRWVLPLSAGVYVWRVAVVCVFVTYLYSVCRCMICVRGGHQPGVTQTGRKEGHTAGTGV